MSLIHDPEAERTSLMMQQPSLCDGQKTGVECHYYWRYVQKVESANPDYLKEGMKGRVCTVTPAYPIEMFSEEKRTKCNFYKPRQLPLLTALGVALKVIDHPHAYDPSAEEYNPLDVEEIKQIHSKRETPISALDKSNDPNATAGFNAAVEELQQEATEIPIDQLKKAMGFKEEEAETSSSLDDKEGNALEERED